MGHPPGCGPQEVRGESRRKSREESMNGSGLRRRPKLGRLGPGPVRAALLLGAWALACEPAERAAPARPNVLLVVIDTARADYLSSYGFPELTTPAID
jgi:hypothetical protein